MRYIISVIAIVIVAALGLLMWRERAVAPGPDGQDTATLKVYFMNDKLDPEITCQKVFPVERTVPYTLGVAQAALKQLLVGPTDAEKAAGYATTIPQGVTLESVTIKDGTAYAAFDETLERSVGGSCRVTAIRQQIIRTLQQFPTVTNVVISINGRTEDILQP